MGQIIEGPWKKSHVAIHRDMFDSLVALLYEFDAALLQEDHTPKMDNGHLDMAQISVSLLLQWAMIQAQKPMHTHGENNEVLQVPIRSRRNPSDGGPNKEGS